MSSITEVEKRYCENILNMKSVYVRVCFQALKAALASIAGQR